VLPDCLFAATGRGGTHETIQKGLRAPVDGFALQIVGHRVRSQTEGRRYIDDRFAILFHPLFKFRRSHNSILLQLHK
jgi:hypothetical protein